MPRAEESLPQFVFVGERLWLDFVNTDDARGGERVDGLSDFEGLVRWMEAAHVVDAERCQALLRRGEAQPSGATAALVEARRVRAALRALAERGRTDLGDRAREVAIDEINRVLSRSVGTRRVEALPGGGFVRSFVPVGDAFGGLVIPIVESTVDTLVRGELFRIRRCADPRCPRFFLDESRSQTRRWCSMRVCGNRAKVRRFRSP